MTHHVSPCKLGFMQIVWISRPKGVSDGYNMTLVNFKTLFLHCKVCWQKKWESLVWKVEAHTKTRNCHDLNDKITQLFMNETERFDTTSMCIFYVSYMLRIFICNPPKNTSYTRVYTSKTESYMLAIWINIQAVDE
jgi:hypothetical protein